MAEGRISVVIPVLNDAAALRQAAPFLTLLRARGHESIVVDGGSSDGSVAVARSLADHVLESAAGRARQMNAGAAVARHSMLWFVHADTRVEVEALNALESMAGDVRWGRFDVDLDAPEWAFRIIGGLMNWRSRVSGVATGDQAIFVPSDLFASVNGYLAIDLMEDIALSRALKTQSAPVCLRVRVSASARYWKKNGIVRSVLTMWGLRLAYRLGAHPARLHALYYGRPSV